MLSLKYSKKCTSYVTSFILHDDLVPRFSMANVEELRVQLYEYPWWEEAKADMKRMARKSKDNVMRGVKGVRGGVALHCAASLLSVSLCRPRN